MTIDVLSEAGVVPDVVKSKPSPDLDLVVSYENETLRLGADVPRQETTTQTPILRVNAANGNDKFNKFTIIMTDPDLFVKNDPTGQVRVRRLLSGTSKSHHANLNFPALAANGLKSTSGWHTRL